MLLSLFAFEKQTCSMKIPEFWQIFASSAENLITILQARDGLSVQSQSSPVQGPEGCSYNSHGSSMQESPSERESQIYDAIIVVLWCLFLIWQYCPLTPCIQTVTVSCACLLFLLLQRIIWARSAWARLLLDQTVSWQGWTACCGALQSNWEEETPKGCC